MKKLYKVKLLPAQGSPSVVEINLSASLNATRLIAQPGTRLQLIDTSTGLAPDIVRVERQGKDLRVSFDDREQADLIVTDFYNTSETASAQVLVGEFQTGVYHAYIPESGDLSRSVWKLSDGASPTGMALGTEQIAIEEYKEPVAQSGMLAGMGLKPLMALPLIFLASAGGGGTTSPEIKYPSIKRAELYSADDTGQSNTDGITNNDKPRIWGITEAYANVTVNINDHAYEGKADAQGEFLVPITDALSGDVQTYKVSASDATGRSTSMDGKPFTLYASKLTTLLGTPVTVQAISQDTGFNSADFITSDNSLTWSGTLNTSLAAFNPAHWLKVELLDAQLHAVDSTFIKPIEENGSWRWTWDDTPLPLADGQYTLNAQLVDTAGNILSAAVTRLITVDTQPQKKWDGQLDPNAAFAAQISQLQNDVGASTHDFLTKNRNLQFTGKVVRSAGSGDFDTDTGRVLAQLIDSTGKIVSFQYLTPDASGNWTLDNSAAELGVPGTVTNYVAKAYVVDKAGNPMHASSHALAIDLQTPTVKQSVSISDLGAYDITALSFTADEQGDYYFNGVRQTTGYLALQGKTTFAKGEFTIRFEDKAGNFWEKINNDAIWDFSLTGGANSIALKTTSSNAPVGYENSELVGSIGKYTMASGQTLDLASLHGLGPQVGDQGAINHVDMRNNGAQTLKLSIADVLALGVENSFSNTLNYVNHLQMRIDGDSNDKLTLSKQWGDSNDQSWDSHGQLTLDGQSYNAYFNQTLALDVFVQAVIKVEVI